MTGQGRSAQRHKAIVCLDSYHNGVPIGRIYDSRLGTETFHSLTQFLINMEDLLNNAQAPQSYTVPRTFPTVTEPLTFTVSPPQLRRGAQATFEIRVIFRQHSSWQGVIHWLEESRQQSFRSVLELVLLMDSALRTLENTGTQKSPEIQNVTQFEIPSC